MKLSAKDLFKESTGIILKLMDCGMYSVKAELYQTSSQELRIRIVTRSRIGTYDEFCSTHTYTNLRTMDDMNFVLEKIRVEAQEHYSNLKTKARETE